MEYAPGIVLLFWAGWVLLLGTSAIVATVALLSLIAATALQVRESVHRHRRGRR